MQIKKLENKLKMTPELQEMINHFCELAYALKENGYLTTRAHAKLIELTFQIKQKAANLNIDLNSLYE